MPDCKCDFTVDFSGSAEGLFKKIKTLIENSGGTLSGDAGGGSFDLPIPVVGDVKGRYSISEQSAELCITDKPFLLPCGAIESYVKNNIPPG
ncbi:MAG: hypothetical protein KAW12_13945 [Candidatus Aminicenantes bacterium]|nr:hypothetical protein [Candidatus Aminicenantes bacterium]